MVKFLVRGRHLVKSRSGSLWLQPAIYTSALLGLSVLAGSASAADQSGKDEAKYTVSRNMWGQPNFEGNWTNSSLTRLERDPAFGSRVEMTPGEVKRLEGERQALVAEQGARTDPDANIDEVNGSCEVKGYTGGPACGYNGAWTDPGDTVMRVAGKARTSFITSTPDGRVPDTKAGVKVTQIGRSGAVRPLPPGVAQNDNPEGRSLGERCIMSFGFSSGPVMQPQLYNSNYQFVQTKDELAIHVEMVHDVRHIRIGGKHRNDGVRPWMGDSVGWWEGNTLVAETINFHPEQRFFGAGESLKVTERFTRVAPDRIHYAFKVEDPKVWAEPWGGEYEFGPAKGQIYEYACHEGNYGLENILAGARGEEREANSASSPSLSAR